MSLEHVLLALLSDAPSSGYDLKKKIDRELDPLWRAELSQVYPSLSKLRRAGFASVKVAGPVRGPGRNVFRITARGRTELARWRGEPPRPPDLRDESMIRVLLAEAASPEAFAEVVRAYDRALSDEMFRLRRRPAATNLSGAVRQAALSRLEAARRWLRTRHVPPHPSLSLRERVGRRAPGEGPVSTSSSVRAGRASRRP